MKKSVLAVVTAFGFCVGGVVSQSVGAANARAVGPIDPLVPLLPIEPLEPFVPIGGLPPIDVIDPGFTIDPDIFIRPPLVLDPCFGASHRFTVDGGIVSKGAEFSGEGVYTAVAIAELTNNDPSGFDGYVRQTEVMSVTAGEVSWNSQDIFVFPGWGWGTGQAFARDTLFPQGWDNSYWGITREIMLESTGEPWEFKFRYIFDNFDGDIEICFFEVD